MTQSYNVIHDYVTVEFDCNYNIINFFRINVTVILLMYTCHLHIFCLYSPFLLIVLPQLRSKE